MPAECLYRERSGEYQKVLPSPVAGLLIVAGFYRLVSGFLNSTGVQLDDGVPGFPAR